jgi:hypothetical protein
MTLVKYFKNLFTRLLTTIFILIIVIFIIAFIYSYSLGIRYDIILIELYGFFINIFYTIGGIMYNFVSIPYLIIKSLIDVFTKFTIIFYFIINMFNGIASFFYDITSVEM